MSTSTEYPARHVANIYPKDTPEREAARVTAQWIAMGADADTADLVGRLMAHQS